MVTYAFGNFTLKYILSVIFKVAKSATVSCSNLLENDRMCILTRLSHMPSFNFFPKSRFWPALFLFSFFCLQKSPLTYCVLGFWHPAKFPTIVVFLKT